MSAVSSASRCDELAPLGRPWVAEIPTRPSLGRSGRSVPAPSRTGFGSVLLKSAFPEAELDFAPAGLYCKIVAETSSSARQDVQAKACEPLRVLKCTSGIPPFSTGYLPNPIDN